jgi:hypothetical protein
MWAVETYTIFDGWVNCWHVDGKQEYFDTQEEAQKELLDHFRDLENCGMSFSPDDYRIVKLTNSP